MTPEKIDLLRHAIGVSSNREPPSPYRNHVCAGPGHTDWETLLELVQEGLMTRRSGTELTGGDDLFHCTEEGKRLAMQAAQKVWDAVPEKRRRYFEWLRIADVCPDLTFVEFLRQQKEKDQPW